jgi:hypothetical protein
MSGSLSGTSIAMIRNFKIHLTIEDIHKRLKGITGALGPEEYELYSLRDSVRKFADCMSFDSPNALRSVQVTAVLFSYRHWTPLEETPALCFVLEPLQDLHVMEPSLRLASPIWERRDSGKQHLANVRSTTT